MGRDECLTFSGKGKGRRCLTFLFVSVLGLGNPADEDEEGGCSELSPAVSNAAGS